LAVHHKIRDLKVDACYLPKVNILWTFEETVYLTKSKIAAEQNTKNFKCEICDYSTPKQSILNRGTPILFIKKTLIAVSVPTNLLPIRI
jgi:hypothetical protein